MTTVTLKSQIREFMLQGHILIQTQDKKKMGLHERLGSLILLYEQFKTDNLYCYYSTFCSYIFVIVINPKPKD